ncbi:DNA-deoxyinosine glycosylase [uncultured Methylophaga sp.]|uniref:DNA-deoxyinosine glycosylase n=1 Tax=uncultured Methylophaga sp. TaxID=285271 RepID=UPI00260FE4E9|nr:DNA-deoxyinosine glycosylase [uncultured Methylophaga sp.]
MSQVKPLSYSFPPIVGNEPKILILGSMPGVASLQAQQYYAHPRNAFWPIMAGLFEFDLALAYPQRCEALAIAGVAVWDVLKACHRPGSLDQHIDPDTIEANDFAGFLARHQQVEAIFFNGAKAEHVFRRHVLPDLTASLTLKKLPSTSPAHASLRLAQKQAAWQIIRDFC